MKEKMESAVHLGNRFWEAQCRHSFYNLSQYVKYNNKAIRYSADAVSKVHRSVQY